MRAATETPIALCDLRVQHEPIQDDIRIAVEEVLQSQQFIGGPQVAALERDVADYCDVGFAVGCSSGSDALLMALMALNIGPGDEVITTPFTFFATAGAIARLGAKPVFVDIEQNGFNIDTDLIEPAITARTKAIIPVHLFGQMSAMEPIMELASKHNLTVVEDAAQALGAEYQTRRAGSIGHVGCFSFFPSKNLGCAGDGGMVVTSDRDLADSLRILRGHGSHPKYYHQVVGGNFRLDTIQAAILLIKLARLTQWNDSRRRAARHYRKLMQDAGLADRIGLPSESADMLHVYNQFCLRSPNRDAIIENLKTHQIGTAIYYPLPLHLQACFADLGYTKGDMPVSEAAANEVFTIPMFPGITIEQQERVVRILGESL